MTRATLPQFWPGARPRPIRHCSKAVFEKRMDGEGAGASIEASARNPGIIRANAARYRPRLAQLS
jgi:hypothetical protein